MPSIPTWWVKPLSHRNAKWIKPDRPPVRWRKGKWNVKEVTEAQIKQLLDYYQQFPDIYLLHEYVQPKHPNRSTIHSILHNRGYKGSHDNQKQMFYLSNENGEVVVKIHNHDIPKYEQQWQFFIHESSPTPLPPLSPQSWRDLLGSAWSVSSAGGGARRVRRRGTGRLRTVRTKPKIPS